MADPEFEYGNPCSSAVHSDEPRTMPVPSASFDPNTRSDQSCIQVGDVQMVLSGGVSLTKRGEDCNGTNTRTQLLHENDHEHIVMHSNTEVKCDQGEIFVTSNLVEEKADNEIDSCTVSQLKHTDTNSTVEGKQCAEDATQESIFAASDQHYVLHEYKFENSSQITRAWREFKKKEDICMKGCKW